LPELHADFPDLAPSAIHRVLQALERKQLVASSGDPSRVYLGAVSFWRRGMPPAVDESLEVIDAELREARVPFDHWVDLEDRRVVVLVPVEQWMWGLVAYDTDELHRPRGAVNGLRTSDQIECVRVDARVTTDSEDREPWRSSCSRRRPRPVTL
jgi:hypothetical protein